MLPGADDDEGGGDDDEAPPPATAAKDAIADAEIAAVPIPTSWRVLLCDDTSVVRLAMKFFLQNVEAGWAVDEAATGERAVEMATAADAKNRYDLILMDQYFGAEGMLGTDATGAIRAAGITAPIVGVTADAHVPDHQARALASGQDCVLGKPFTDVGKFRRTLQRLLHERGVRGPPAAKPAEKTKEEKKKKPAPPKEKSAPAQNKKKSKGRSRSPSLEELGAEISEAEWAEFDSEARWDEASAAPSPEAAADAAVLPVVDTQGLDHDEKLLATLARIFLRQLFDGGALFHGSGGGTLVRLVAAGDRGKLTERTLKAIRYAAFNLKGSALTMGCPALRRAAIDIFRATRSVSRSNGGNGDSDSDSGGGGDEDWDTLIATFKAERARYVRWFGKEYRDS